MKVSITDQFLQDVYDAFADIREAVSKMPHQRRDFYYIGARDNPVLEKYRRMTGTRRFNNFVSWLKRNNYIRSKNLQGKPAIMITRKGVEKLGKVFLKNQRKDLRKRRDGKLIMIVFDVPRRYRKSRALLMSILQNLGYELFQQSVWVSPYDVSEKTEALLQAYDLDRYVRLFFIEKL